MQLHQPGSPRQRFSFYGNSVQLVGYVKCPRKGRLLRLHGTLEIKPLFSSLGEAPGHGILSQNRLRPVRHIKDLLISAVIRIFRRPVWAQCLYHIHFFCRSVKIQIHIYRLIHSGFRPGRKRRESGTRLGPGKTQNQKTGKKPWFY